MPWVRRPHGYWTVSVKVHHHAMLLWERVYERGRLLGEATSLAHFRGEMLLRRDLEGVPLVLPDAGRFSGLWPRHGDRSHTSNLKGISISVVETNQTTG